ncbi:MAG TPA: 4Fe-4S binding protein, partial [Terriglobia bacterium]|nr:4Fe-4S binding protein [Terriglobia bacterium]
YVACEDGAHQSITVRRMSEEEFASHAGNGGAQRVDYSGGVRVMPGMGDGYANIFEIDQQMCVGCNLCSLVCPVSGCISMLERPSQIPHLTWRQYQEELAQGKVHKIQPPAHV